MFCNSTAESTKKTYSTSTNHFKSFIVSCAVLPSIRWVPNQLSLNGLIICFYTAYLFRLPSIKSATTIENYSRQLKSAWQKTGILLTEFDKLVLTDMIKGAKRLLPNVPDTRPAFLLPHYNLPFIFERPLTTNQFVLKAAVIWGFLGMFRFVTYNNLGVHNLVIVGGDGRTLRLESGCYDEVVYYFTKRGAAGFYFQFADKYHPIAHAFYCW